MPATVVGVDPAGDPHRPRRSAGRLADVPEAGARPPRLGRRGHHRAGRQVVDRGRPVREVPTARSSSSAAWVERPMTASVPPSPGGRVGDMSSWPDVDTVRSDGRGQVGPVVEDERHPVDRHRPAGQRPARGTSCPSSRCFSRSWTTSTPPSMHASTKRLEVRSVGCAQVQPPVRSRPQLASPAHRARQADVEAWPWLWPSSAA